MLTNFVIKISTEMENKKCNTCNEIKPLKDFHKSSTNKDGHISQCKECKNAAIRLSLFKAGKRRTPELIKQFEEPINPDRTHKICYVCEKSKPLDDFYKEFKESEIGWGTNRNNINYCSQSLYHFFYTK